MEKVVFYPEVEGAEDILGVVEHDGRSYDIPVKGHVIVNELQAAKLKRIYPFLEVFDVKDFNKKKPSVVKEDEEEIKEEIMSDPEIETVIQENKDDISKLTWTELQAEARSRQVYKAKMKRPEMEEAVRQDRVSKD
jgi:hypothetical protein